MPKEVNDGVDWSTPIPDFDFGISFEGDDLENAKQREEELESLARFIYKRVEPLIDNLCKSPDTDTIKWPNRAKVLGQLKQELRDALAKANVDVA